MAGGKEPGRLAGTPPLIFERGVAVAAILPGQFLKRDGNGKLDVAGDGDFVVGIAVHDAAADGIVLMLVEGDATIRARTGASWAATRKVRAGASSQADEGSGELHYLGRLLNHDGTNNLATVALQAGRPTMNELGQTDNDLDFDGAVLVKQYALMMSGFPGP